MEKPADYYGALAGEILYGHIQTPLELEQVAKFRQGKTFAGLCEDFYHLAPAYAGGFCTLEECAKAVSEALEIDTTQPLNVYIKKLNTVRNFHQFLKKLWHAKEAI